MLRIYGSRRQDHRGPSARGTLPRLPIRSPYRFRPRINFLSLWPLRHGPYFPEVSALARVAMPRLRIEQLVRLPNAEPRRRKR